MFLTKKTSFDLLCELPEMSSIIVRSIFDTFYIHVFLQLKLIDCDNCYSLLVVHIVTVGDYDLWEEQLPGIQAGEGSEEGT